MLWIAHRGGVVPPPLLDTLAFTAFSNLVAVGDFLYVTAPSDGVFYEIDKSDPSNLGTPNDFGTVAQRPITTLGTKIYVVGGGELHVWDVSSTPSLDGSTSTGGAISNAVGMAAAASRVYTAHDSGSNGQVRNFSVSTPSAPTLTSTFSNSNLNGAAGLAFQGSHVYVAATEADRIGAVDISTPGSMTLADSETHADLDGVVDCQINLQYVYLVSPVTGKLVVYDKSTPTALSYVTSVDIADAVVVEVAGDHAFVLTDDGAGAGGLVVLDITSPEAPSVISAATVSGLLAAPRDMALDDDVLFVADEGNGAIYAFDVSMFP
jgi:hypothetical protein